MPAYSSAASGSGVLPSIVVSKPAGTADGDLLIAVLSFYMQLAGRDVNSVPSGWTLLRTLDNFSQSNHRTSVYWKIAASEPSTWTFGTNATVAHGQCWAAIAISSPVSPYITDSSGQIDPNTAPTSHTAPSVNAGSAADMLVYVGGGRSSSITAWTPPTGYTERVDVYESSASNSIEVASKAAAGASGATGTVNATSAVGDDMESILIAVTGAGAAPVANFTGTPTSGTASLSVTFTDSSTNTPTSWAWDFGDGGTSSSQNPTHSYTTSGTYTVVLVATNATGSDTKTRTGYVVVSEAIAYATGGGIDIY